MLVKFHNGPYIKGARSCIEKSLPRHANELPHLVASGSFNVGFIFFLCLFVQITENEM